MRCALLSSNARADRDRTRVKRCSAVAGEELNDDPVEWDFMYAKICDEEKKKKFAICAHVKVMRHVDFSRLSSTSVTRAPLAPHTFTRATTRKFTAKTTSWQKRLAAADENTHTRAPLIGSAALAGIGLTSAVTRTRRVRISYVRVNTI
jgi:hypothetical protein